MAFFTSAEAATVACVVMAPMVTAPLVTVMPLSAAMPPRSTSADGAARPIFIEPSRDWPPATILASAAAAALAASATEAGVW